MVRGGSGAVSSRILVAVVDAVVVMVLFIVVHSMHVIPRHAICMVRELKGCSNALRTKFRVLIPFVSEVTCERSLGRMTFSIPPRSYVAGSGVALRISNVLCLGIISPIGTSCNVSGFICNIARLTRAAVHSRVNGLSLSHDFRRHRGVGARVIGTVSGTSRP